MKRFDYLKGREVAIRIESTELIDEMITLARQWGLHIHCLLVHSSVPVAHTDFRKVSPDIPLGLFAPTLGRFRDLVPRLQDLRKLNIRVYLPLDSEENFAGLRILSSLGIASAAIFQEVNNQWEKVSDLMTYALLGRVVHAQMDPFHYMAENYSADQRNDFSVVYLNDPARFVHVDDVGRIALSVEDLYNQEFVAKEIEDLDSFTASDEYQNRLEKWRRFFLRTDGCAYCEGWRICLGKFSEDHCKNNNGCVGFFKEFLEVIEQYQSLKMQKKQLWQP